MEVSERSQSGEARRGRGEGGFRLETSSPEIRRVHVVADAILSPLIYEEAVFEVIVGVRGGEVMKREFLLPPIRFRGGRERERVIKYRKS